jgi:hypothetical protein
LKKADLSGEHVPPKLFHPKSMRPNIRKQLWKVPSHKECNESYRMDEEYLYVFLAGMVYNQNPEMGEIILADLKERAKDPQTKSLVRRLVQTFANITPGGIYLPPGHGWLQPDMVRIQNVVIKIAQYIYFKDLSKYLPRKWCTHIELCQTPEDIPPLFKLMIHVEPKHVVPEVFSYRHACVDGTHLYSLLFWRGFMFCLAFDDPRHKGKTLSQRTRKKPDP